MIAKAIIFDFDGVIADTEPVHYQAFQEVLEPLGLGYSWAQYLDFYAGFDDRDAFRERFRLAGRDLPATELKRLGGLKAQAFERLVASGVAKPYPGVVALVREQQRVRPVGLCSGAVVSDILPVLSTLGIREAFQIIVTAEDVHASKPDPACYRLAVERLGHFCPEECVAIEDTPAGIQAAKAAGLQVIAVTNTYGREKLSGADQIVPTLEGLQI